MERRRPARSRVTLALCLGMCAAVSSCDWRPGSIALPPLPARPDAGVVGAAISCQDETTRRCQGNVHIQCERHGEFLEAVETDCATTGQICDLDRTCITCKPGTASCRDCTGKGDDCNPNIIEVCADDASGYVDSRECGLDAPEVCSAGACVNACKLAQTQDSYAGCEFYAADLDNAAIDDMSNASAQQYAVVVANPQRVPVSVTVEQNDAAFGDPVAATQVDQQLVAPGDLAVFKLPRREVDGSSEFGINDGTNTCVSSNAYHVISTYPISAYQFNPLENVNVFSNDASLLLPVPALGTDYTVDGWPQTIGNSSNPDQDFDHTSSNEDLRATLTIIGAQKSTHLKIALGRKVVEVVGAGPIPTSHAGDMLELDIGPFDVVNLETQGFDGDFTGSHIQASSPVAVFVGSEASDVPTFGTYATRQCCADHLEEQLIPDRSAGTSFVVGRMPSRTHALNNAALPGAPLGVAEINEPEWIRVVATATGMTHVKTTLDAPDDDITLTQYDDAILRADRDFTIDSDRPIHVMELLASQGVTGIPSKYPGGDPDLIAVPPVDQWRQTYIFLTPDKYAFDFVTMVAPPDATIVLDGSPLPDTCETTPAADWLRSASGSEAMYVVHRCQLSFPEVTNGISPSGLMGGGSDAAIVRVLPGEQHDGAHTVVSDSKISLIVNGFDRFVSYGYVGGLNLTSLN